MKKLVLSLLAATVAVPTAAHAQNSDSGVRFELVASVDDYDRNLGRSADQFNPVRDRDLDVGLGAAIGYDFVRGNGARIGVDLEYNRNKAKSNVFNSAGTLVGEVVYGSEIYGGARVTYFAGKNIAAVIKAGVASLDSDYNAFVVANSNSNSLTGIRGAVGIQFGNEEEPGIYYGIEGRYTNYEKGLVRKSAALVIGHRF